jgi:hypothetical protein
MGVADCWALATECQAKTVAHAINSRRLIVPFRTPHRPRVSTKDETDTFPEPESYIRYVFDFCLPTKSNSVPTGPDWLHEVKYDGYRLRPYQAGRPKHWVKVKNRQHPAMERVMEVSGPSPRASYH